MKLKKWVKVVLGVIIVGAFIGFLVWNAKSNEDMINNCINNGYDEAFCVRSVNR